MPAYQSSSVSLLFDSDDAYDNYLGKIIAGGVVADQKLSPLILKANKDNPSRRQTTFNSNILRDFPQYIPQAIETVIETPNPYAQVNDAFDYIVRTNTLLGGGSRALRSSINQELQNSRKALGDFSFIRPIAPAIVYRTLNTSYRYNLANVDSFEVPYALPYVKIKQTLTKGEYVNHWIFRNRHDLHNQEEWRPSNSDKLYPIDDDGNIVLDLTNIGHDLSEPNLLIPGYNAHHRYTFMEYMVVVGTVGNLARGVYAYNHTMNNNRDTIMDNLLVPNLQERFGDPLTGKFYPIIPMRRNNVSTKSQIPDRVKKLFDDKYNLDLDEHFDKIETNSSIAEIDDMYLVHGVPLNSKKQSHKRYLFEFFDLYLAYSNNLKLTIQNDGFIVQIFSTLFGKITNTSFTAEQLAMAVNDVAITLDGNIVQISKRFADKIETINIRDLSHTTVTGDGGTITISAQTALGDPQYDEFMLPLHAPTIESMRREDRISVSGANLYFVVNSYGFIRREWWEPILEVFIVAIQASAVLASVLFPPAGLLGKLGGVVVTGLALTGTAAVITGAIVSTVAAALIGKAVINAGSKALGKREAIVLAAVVSLVLTRAGANPFQSWQELSNLSKGNLITNALADIHTITTKDKINRLNQENEEVIRSGDAALDDIQKKLDAISSNNNFTPIYDAITKSHLFYEEPESFLNRTTLVGSDLVNMHLDLVNNYVDNSLELPIIGTNQS